MRAMYDDAHVVIVPTTSDFIEGFNKVVAEAVLAGKPVITSSVCPALEYVRDAVIEVTRMMCGRMETRFWSFRAMWNFIRQTAARMPRGAIAVLRYESKLGNGAEKDARCVIVLLRLLVLRRGLG